jgi:hypothetical protein
MSMHSVVFWVMTCGLSNVCELHTDPVFRYATRVLDLCSKMVFLHVAKCNQSVPKLGLFLSEIEFCKHKKKTPWSESASELYRSSDRRLSAK